MPPVKIAALPAPTSSAPASTATKTGARALTTPPTAAAATPAESSARDEYRSARLPAGRVNTIRASGGIVTIKPSTAKLRSNSSRISVKIGAETDMPKDMTVNAANVAA